jgi:hypothetical protein
VQRKKALKSAECTVETQRRFYIDFGFMRASSSDYGRQDKSRACVIKSWDGYSLYLSILDEASRFLWVFLKKSKEPPLDIVETFLGRFGHANGGVVRTDQGGELARSSEFCDTILHNYQYVIEPMGADSPSQNGAAEIYNGKLAVRACTLYPAPAFSRIFCRPHCYTRCTCTIGWCIPLHGQPLLSSCLGLNRTCLH